MVGLFNRSGNKTRVQSEHQPKSHDKISQINGEKENETTDRQ